MASEEVQGLVRVKVEPGLECQVKTEPGTEGETEVNKEKCDVDNDLGFECQVKIEERLAPIEVEREWVNDNIIEQQLELYDSVKRGLQNQMAQKEKVEHKINKNKTRKRKPWRLEAEISSSTTDSPDIFVPVFNRAKVSKTYTKPGPTTAFVPGCTSLNINMVEPENDPLKIDNLTEQKSDKLPPVPDQNRAEVVIKTENCPEEQITHNTTKSDLLKCDQTTQTSTTDTLFTEIGSNFGLQIYRDNDKAIKFYTGLDNFETLMNLYNSLGDCTRMKYTYRIKPKIHPVEQLFMTLLILKKHYDCEEVSMLYLMPEREVANIFVSWIYLMAERWKKLAFLIEKAAIDSIAEKYMPEITPVRYVKNRIKAKFIVGISQNGLITYVSPSYKQWVSDKHVIQRCNILSKINTELKVNQKTLFLPFGVNMPLLVKKSRSTQINKLKDSGDDKGTHVEVAMNVLKTFNILSDPLKHRMETHHLDKIAFVCAMLVNFRINSKL